MRKLAFWILGALMFQLPLPVGAHGDEIATRKAIRSRVVSLIVSRDFAELEALSARYRKSKSRTSSGLWRLTLFYSGIATVIDIRRRDDGFWKEAAEITREWLQAHPESPSAHLAHARMLIHRGWSYRGGGYSSEVRSENWAPFDDYIERARIYLETHKSVASVDPHWYELMAEVARLQSWPEPEFMELVLEGLQKEPLFYQTHFMAINYYLPKWHGNVEDIEKFARTAVKITNASEGYGMYARIYWYASQIQFGSRLFSRTRIDWPTMKLGIDDVLKKYPDAWNLNNFARFACLARDKEKTAELISRIGNSPMQIVWRSHGFYARCVTWALGNPA